MNWEAIGEIVGAIGVIVSLLYLAVQIRGDASAKRASTVHEQSDAYRSFLQMIALNGDLGEIFMKGLRDFESLDDTEHIRFSSHLGFLFRVFEDNYFQWREGNLDPNHWHGYAAPLSDTVAYPGVRAWWATRAHWYSAPFGEFVQAKMNESGRPALYREPDAE